MLRLFRDRIEAGRKLTERVAGLGLESPVVLGLPRGGVPVAAEVAAGLDAPLDVLVARKIGAPGNPELGVGAVAEGRVEPVLSDVAYQLNIGPAELSVRVEQARLEVRDRVQRYRGDRPLPDLRGRDVVLVDDGLATGVTAEAALRALRMHEPGTLVLAVPVCAQQTRSCLLSVADRIACVEVVAVLYAVGEWYRDFSPTTDKEVIDALARRAR